MKFRTITLVGMLLLFIAFLFQSHSAGRAGNNNRDNTGAPGGQAGGNGRQISCENCHSGGNIEVGLNLELLDLNNNPIERYIPNEVYTAKVTIATLSDATPNGYGFQMVSLLDTDNSDVNGWIEDTHSSNVQLALANSTGRVYAEQDGTSTSNEFIIEWRAPEANNGDVSFYFCLLYTSPSPRDRTRSRMPSSA